MPFQKRNLRGYAPRDLRDAFRACKDHARARRNLSVERIAERIDATPESLYKWMADGRMPAAKIPAFEAVCGAHFVSDYLAAAHGRIAIAIPRGHHADVEDLAGLQAVLADAVGKLARFWHGRATMDETLAGLTISLQALAWHRENVRRADEPELDLGADQDEA